MGAFAIGLILARPQLGSIADKYGRKQVLMIGLLVGAVAPLGYLLTRGLSYLNLSPTELSALTIRLLFCFRAFHGISIAAFTTAYAAYVVDHAEPSRRTEILGYTSLVTPIGVGVGPVLGGWVQRTYGYEALFLMSSALACMGLLCIFTLKDVRKTDTATDVRNEPQSWMRSLAKTGELLVAPRLRILSLVMFCAGSTFGVLSTFMPLHVRQMGIDFQPDFYYFFAAGASFSMRLLTGKVAERLGKGRFISLSIVCYFLSMILLWQGESPLLLIASGLLEGTAGGLLIPVVSAIVADRSQDHERGQVFSICLGGFDVGIALAGPLFGSLTPYIGLPSTFLGASFISVLSLIIFILYGNHSVRRSVRFALGREPDFYALTLSQ